MNGQKRLKLRKIKKVIEIKKKVGRYTTQIDLILRLRVCQIQSRRRPSGGARSENFRKSRCPSQYKGTNEEPPKFLLCFLEKFFDRCVIAEPVVLLKILPVSFR